MAFIGHRAPHLPTSPFRGIAPSVRTHPPGSRAPAARCCWRWRWHHRAYGAVAAGRASKQDKEQDKQQEKQQAQVATSADQLPPGQGVDDMVIELAGWVVASNDSQGYPFAIMDNASAQILVFGGDGKLRGAAPGLFGSAIGDHTAPGVAGLALREIPGPDRTTPAGRFSGGYGPSIDAGRVLWVDYDSAVSIHPTATQRCPARHPHGALRRREAGRPR